MSGERREGGAEMALEKRVAELADALELEAERYEAAEPIHWRALTEATREHATRLRVLAYDQHRARRTETATVREALCTHQHCERRYSDGIWSTVHGGQCDDAHRRFLAVLDSHTGLSSQDEDARPDTQTRRDQDALDRASHLRSLMHRSRDSRAEHHLTLCGIRTEGVPNTNGNREPLTCPRCADLNDPETEPHP